MTIAMRFSVRVPVLSAHSTVASPSVSMAAPCASIPGARDPPGTHHHEDSQRKRKFLRKSSSGRRTGRSLLCGSGVVRDKVVDHIEAMNADLYAEICEMGRHQGAIS